MNKLKLFDQISEKKRCISIQFNNNKNLKLCRYMYIIK